jgi:hypothetical protein
MLLDPDGYGRGLIGDSSRISTRTSGEIRRVVVWKTQVPIRSYLSYCAFHSRRQLRLIKESARRYPPCVSNFLIANS